MLKKLITRLRSAPPQAQPRILTADEHQLNPGDISAGARRVIDELVDNGYQAYLVGGGVRDLLLGGHPKDMDIATDATPEEVKSLFRSSRIVGRRFKIVHVRMGREVTEVTTFRADHSEGGSQAATNSDGMLVRDNVYGDIRSDALRRDFTMNALYYSPHNNTITDFTTGVEDIAKRCVRMIGDPATRYQEDPVRMLRAVRLATKLDFEIEPATAKPIYELSNLLANIPAARLFDDVMKLFMSGYADVTYQGLRHYNLFDQLFPDAQRAIDESDIAQAFLKQATINTDKRIHNNQRVTPAFLLAVILWPAVEALQKQLQSQGLSPTQALQESATDLLMRQCARVAIPKRFTQAMREIWLMQERLHRRSGKQAERLLEQQRFRAAYDFLLLREQAGEDHQGLGKWWTLYQNADGPRRAQMVDDLPRGSSGPSKRRRRRKPKAS